MKLKYLGRQKPVFKMSYLLEGPYDFSESDTCEVGDADVKMMMKRNPKMFLVVEGDLPEEDEEEGTFNCSVEGCDKEYKTKHYLAKHIEAKHPDFEGE